jgi:hypothetical protein
MAQGKSPFELRADLLSLAFEILLSQHRARGISTTTGQPESAPTSEEVIEEARKLNDFISKSGGERRDRV